ncbi:MAG: hypothetical protein ACRC8S_17960 [Fimbriiglobus sp.]
MTSRPSAWPLALVLIFLSLSAVVLDLSAFHRLHNADSIIPILVSTQKWTFYYWEQNRFGMLVAGLALPFKNPLTNLFVQNGITIWCGLAVFPLAAKFFGSRRPLSVGLFAAALFIFASPSLFQFLYLSTVNVFATSLALSFAALNLLSDRTRSAKLRYPLAFAAMLLGVWVNAALGLFLLPLVVLVWLVQTPRSARRLIEMVALCVICQMINMVMQKLAPYPSTFAKIPPFDQWWELLVRPVVLCWSEIQPRPFYLCFGLLTLLAVGQLLIPRWRTSVRRGLLTLLAVSLGSLAYVVLMMICFDGRWRYATPSLVLMHLAAVVAVTEVFFGEVSLRAELIRIIIAGLSLIGAIMVNWEPPSREHINDPTLYIGGGKCTSFAELGCTHIAGDFWPTWVAIWNLNCKYYPEGHCCYGVAFRCDPTASSWKSVPRSQVRVGCYSADHSADVARGRFPYRLKLLEVRGQLEIWVPEDNP